MCIRDSTKPDEGEVTKEHFTLYKKTDSGQTETAFGDAPPCVESILDKALIGDGAKFQVDFSLFFTAVDGPTGSLAQIFYPSGGAEAKIVFNGTSQEAGTLTATRVAIYDADRENAEDETPLCAEFDPTDNNQFTGASMV